MVNRTQQVQSTHDAVIAARDRAWQGDRRYIQSWMNPGSQRNANYKLNGVEQHPDLIIGLKVNGNDQHGIEEVETPDSVNASEVQQWKNYAALPQASWFNLLVPSGSVAEAKKLAKGLALNVVGYSRDANGRHRFSKGEAPDK